MNNIDLVDLTYLLISAQLVGLQKRSTCLEAMKDKEAKYYLRTQCATGQPAQPLGIYLPVVRHCQ